MGVLNVLRLVYRNIVVNTDPGSILILVGLPAMYLVFFGFGYQSLISNESHSYLLFLAPGIMSFQAVIAGTVGGSMLWADRMWGMLAQLLVGPITRLEYLLGILFTTLLFGLAGAYVMLLASFALIGSISLSAQGVALITFSIVLGSLLFGSLMLLIAALVKSNNAYNSVQVLLLFVINFASTVFYPYGKSLPLAIRALFVVNPLTYIANTVRDGFNSHITLYDLYEVGLILFVTLFLLWLSKRAYERALLALT